MLSKYQPLVHADLAVTQCSIQANGKWSVALIHPYREFNSRIYQATGKIPHFYAKNSFTYLHENWISCKTGKHVQG